MKNKILIGLIVATLIIIAYIVFGLFLMDEEDSRGEFYDLYDKIDENDNYFVVIDEKEAFFAQLFGDHFFVEESNCYKRIEDFRNKRIKVYQFLPTETFVNFTIEDAKKIKKLNTTELFFSN